MISFLFMSRRFDFSRQIVMGDGQTPEHLLTCSSTISDFSAPWWSFRSNAALRKLFIYHSKHDRN